MTSAALLAPLFGVRASPLTLWLLALAVVLAIDPLAITSQGFWYSFVAVAALLYGMAGRQGGQRWTAKLCKPQWLVFVLLMPLLMINGQPISPLSPLINLAAIPAIGIGVVPLLLVSALLQFVLPELANILISLLDYALTGFQNILTWFSGFAFYIPAGASLSWPALVLSFLAMVVLLSPSSLRLRMLSPFLLIPALFPKSHAMALGQAEVMVLDVGQGLSVLIKTRQHLLVYDTGDRFSERMSAAGSVIIPALSAWGVNQVDKIMISHGDKDHCGGLQPLLARYQQPPVTSGTKIPGYDGERTECRAGEQWDWDGVHFQVLSGGNYRRSNDASCVLKVTAGKDSIILPGDASDRVERKLLEQSVDLQANVLVAAHHGSRSSSSSDFLAAVGAQTVIFSSGFANRFGHPSPAAVERVRQTGADIYNTAYDGSLLLSLGRGDAVVTAYRKAHARFWWN